MFGSSRPLLALLLLLLGLGGCGSDDSFTADVAGKYTVAVTNQKSTCDFMNWEEGAEASGIELAITQEGKSIHGTIGGITGALFVLAFGSAEFDGTIHEDSLELHNYGSRATTTGNCVYTYNSTVSGKQTGDNISGTITYASKTNGNPDCDDVECSASQKLSGARPPR